VGPSTKLSVPVLKEKHNTEKKNHIHFFASSSSSSEASFIIFMVA